MTKNEENKLSMYEGVIQVLTTNAAAYASIPVIGTMLTEFQGAVDAIKAQNYNFLDVTKGATKDKVEREEKLIDSTVTLASILSVYALNNGDNLLGADVKVTKSMLDSLRDTELVNKARLIIDAAEANKLNLVDYGVTDIMITDAQAALAAFDSSINAQQEKYAERSANREKLFGLFGNTDDILYNKLDPMMELFVSSNQDFYNAYQAARVIKDLGISGSSETISNQ